MKHTLFTLMVVLSFACVGQVSVQFDATYRYSSNNQNEYKSISPVAINASDEKITVINKNDGKVFHEISVLEVNELPQNKYRSSGYAFKIKTKDSDSYVLYEINSDGTQKLEIPQIKDYKTYFYNVYLGLSE